MSIRLDTQALPGSCTATILAAGAIVDSHIASNAAIAWAKIAASLAIKNSDIATDAAIAYSKLALTGSITAADLAAGAALKLLFGQPTGTVNGTNTLYTVGTAPSGYNVWVYKNGIKQLRVTAATLNTADPYFYMASNDTIITLGLAPAVGDDIDCIVAY